MPKILRNVLHECDEDIAKLYLQTAAVQLKKMESAARSKSMAEVQKHAHSLSGASAFLGLKEMTKLLKELEQAASQSQSKKVNRCIGLLKEEFDHVHREYYR